VSFSTPSTSDHYEIRFQSLSHDGRAFTFPCDEDGNVPLDTLSDRARQNYSSRVQVSISAAMRFLSSGRTVRSICWPKSGSSMPISFSNNA
jgi:hypothetical protein